VANWRVVTLYLVGGQRVARVGRGSHVNSERRQRFFFHLPEAVYGRELSNAFSAYYFIILLMLIKHYE